MYSYEVNKKGSGNLMMFRSMKDIERHTGLSEKLIKKSIGTGMYIEGWNVRRGMEYEGVGKKARIGLSDDDGYLAIKDEETRYFSDIRSASIHTGVSQTIIKDCIMDGGCSRGWFFDLALQREDCPDASKNTRGDKE